MPTQIIRTPSTGSEVGRTKSRVSRIERALGARPGLDHVVVCASLPGDAGSIAATSTRWYPTFGVRFYELFVSRIDAGGDATVTMRRNGVTISTLTIASGEFTAKVAVDLLPVAPQQYVDFVISGFGEGFTVQAKARSHGQDSGAVGFSVAVPG